MRTCLGYTAETPLPSTAELQVPLLLQHTFLVVVVLMYLRMSLPICLLVFMLMLWRLLLLLLLQSLALVLVLLSHVRLQSQPCSGALVTQSSTMADLNPKLEGEPVTSRANSLTHTTP